MYVLLTSFSLAVYKSEKTPLGEFLGATKSILHTLAGHAQEIQRITRSKYQNSVDTMPKGTRGVTLLYHQVGTLCFVVMCNQGHCTYLAHRSVRHYGHQTTISFCSETRTGEL